MKSSKVTYVKTILITFIMFSFIHLSSAYPNNYNNNSRTGFTARLIPPTNPKSPFYNRILEANNISSMTSNNITLTRTHYLEWLNVLSSSSSSSLPPKPPRSRKSLRTRWNFDDDRKFSKVYFNNIAGYVMQLYVGSPFQYVFGQFDTGSDLVWFQCEGVPPGSKLPHFNQSKSASYRIMPCNDVQKCDQNTTSAELSCSDSGNCMFDIVYYDYTHATGNMATEVAVTLTDTQTLNDLMFGCSFAETKEDMGVIGGGLGKYSFPMQLTPNNPKFSYCFSYNESKATLIKFGDEANLMGKSTKFLKNKHKTFYYLDVLGILVHNEPIDIAPYEFEMSEDGTRGFIIDSGTTFTEFSPKVYDAMKSKLEKLLGSSVHYLHYDICYPPSTFTKVVMPRIGIQFPEFDFVLPVEGTWEDIPKANLMCLLITRTGLPMSLLGYEQLYDVNIGVDINNSLLYLIRTQCETFG